MYGSDNSWKQAFASSEKSAEDPFVRPIQTYMFIRVKVALMKGNERHGRCQNRANSAYLHIASFMCFANFTKKVGNMHRI